jgi:hypothetical protein
MWTDPALAALPIAGYNVYLYWIDANGNLQSSSTFVVYGTDTATLTAPSGDNSYFVEVVAVNASGQEGAYPLSGTGVTFS